jgi:hypothetical protein
MSKYTPLRDWLFSASKIRVNATFQEIDNLVGGLPMSARKHSEWWSNEDVDTTNHSHCKSWQAAGYKADADLKLEKVTFTRD